VRIASRRKNAITTESKTYCFRNYLVSSFIAYLVDEVVLSPDRRSGLSAYYLDFCQSPAGLPGKSIHKRLIPFDPEV
jgi:hypothetical protein